MPDRLQVLFAVVDAEARAMLRDRLVTGMLVMPALGIGAFVWLCVVLLPSFMPPPPAAIAVHSQGPFAELPAGVSWTAPDPDAPVQLHARESSDGWSLELRYDPDAIGAPEAVAAAVRKLETSGKALDERRRANISVPPPWRFSDDENASGDLPEELSELSELRLPAFMAGALFHTMLALMLYPVVEVAIGDREQRTLEATAASPGSMSPVLIGKLLAAVAVGVGLAAAFLVTWTLTALALIFGTLPTLLGKGVSAADVLDTLGAAPELSTNLPPLPGALELVLVGFGLLASLATCCLVLVACTLPARTVHTAQSLASYGWLLLLGWFFLGLGVWPGAGLWMPGVTGPASLTALMEGTWHGGTAVAAIALEASTFLAGSVLLSRILRHERYVWR